MYKGVYKETGRFRQLWIYFKKGKNEINFLMNIYQTLILIFSISFIGDMPLRLIILGTFLFAISFMFIAVIIGRYTAKKVDPSGAFISPYAQDENQYRLNLSRGFIYMINENKEQAIYHFKNCERISLKWLKDE